MKKEIFNLKLVLIFAALSFSLASPFIYRAWLIHEIYLYPDVREHVLDSIFLLRENYGLTIGDLTINNVVIKDSSVYTTIHEKYHGFVNESKYDDLEQDYVVKYAYNNDTLVVDKIIKSGK